MKKITQLSFVAIASLMLIATACKKSPSAQIYNTWKLTNVEMPDADSVAIAQMKAADVVYTFKKDGSYNYDIQGTTGSGTFSINEEGTQITTTEDGKTETMNSVLSETSLTLSKGSEKMIFTAKK